MNQSRIRLNGAVRLRITYRISTLRDLPRNLFHRHTGEFFHIIFSQVVIPDQLLQKIRFSIRYIVFLRQILNLPGYLHPLVINNRLYRVFLQGRLYIPYDILTQ